MYESIQWPAPPIQFRQMRPIGIPGTYHYTGLNFFNAMMIQSILSTHTDFMGFRLGNRQTG